MGERHSSVIVEQGDHILTQIGLPANWSAHNGAVLLRLVAKEPDDQGEGQEDDTLSRRGRRVGHRPPSDGTYSIVKRTFAR